ncbi:MAG: hypothetical protein WCH83_02495 [Alphaproteobacteria bacterium]
MTDATPLSESDFTDIEAAVMETARGRWFLAEYARRNRHSDTQAVLGAIDRLEAAMGARAAAPEADRIRMDLREMAGAIARTKAEIASIKPDGEGGGRFEDASVELDAIVKATETATGEILSAAETIQEIAWTLRELGTEAEVCDLIDVKSTDIYTACSFQDITGQRTRKVIQVLRFLEDRIDSMMQIWGNAGPAASSAPLHRADEPSLLNGPARPGEGLVQGDVDDMMADPIFAGEPASSAADDIFADSAPVIAEPAPITTQPAPSIAPEPVPMEARETAAAALSTGEETPRATKPRRARPIAGEAVLPEGLPTIEDIEKLAFVEKVALTS